jgi:hypothetical protein
MAPATTVGGDPYDRVRASGDRLLQQGHGDRGEDPARAERSHRSLMGHDPEREPESQRADPEKLPAPPYHLECLSRYRR